MLMESLPALLETALEVGAAVRLPMRDALLAVLAARTGDAQAELLEEPQEQGEGEEDGASATEPLHPNPDAGIRADVLADERVERERRQEKKEAPEQDSLPFHELFLTRRLARDVLRANLNRMQVSGTRPVSFLPRWLLVALATGGVAVLAVGAPAAAPDATTAPNTAQTTAPSPAAISPVNAASLARRLAAAERLLHVGQAAGARSELEALAETNWPCRDLSLLLLGRAQLAMGEPSLALASARRVVASVTASVRADDAAWLAADALKAAHSSEAADAYGVAAARFPDDPRADRMLVDQAESLEFAGPPAEAAAAWWRAATVASALAPADATARALRLARAAGTSLRPLTAAEHGAIARNLSRANLHERAAEAWTEAARGAKGEDAARCSLERARSLLNLRRNDAARETCEDGLRRHPASPIAAECSLIIARAASRQGDGATIERLAVKALADPRWKAEGWRHDLGALRASRLADDGRWSDAADAYARLGRESQGDRAVEAAWKAAWILLESGRAVEAAAAMHAIADKQGLDSEVGRNAALWRALALERAPRAENRPDPVELLAALYRARPWSYYGQQAREQLAFRVSPEALRALDAEALDSGIIFDDPGSASLPGAVGERYVLLRDAGLFADALPEIEALGGDPARKAGLSRESKAFLFELAQARSRAGDLSRGSTLLSRLAPEALRLPSRRSPIAFWEVIYPRPHGEIVDRLALRAEVDPAFCSAIVRAESAWRPEVRSPADARGLMQLIPPTANRLARQAGLSGFDAEQLFDPEVNVRLGVLYLGQLLALFDGDMAAAAASYNAGEMKVAEWWQAHDAKGTMDPARRIESIPYRETRVYVKRVLEATGWYRWLEGCDAATVSRVELASGQ